MYLIANACNLDGFEVQEVPGNSHMLLVLQNAQLIIIITTCCKIHS